jgi:outer membrane protein assembly factor BamA
MTKVKHLLAAIFFLTTSCTGWSQGYALQYRTAENDTAVFSRLRVPLKTIFSSREEASVYIFQLPSVLQSQGFMAASVDSIAYDSSFARLVLYLGPQYTFTRLTTAPEDEELLRSLGWPKEIFSGAPDFSMLQTWQQKILDYLEEHGHPFGKVFLDSIRLETDSMQARLRIVPGPLYKIDSMPNNRNARVSNEFLQRYLEIPNGSTYNKKKLQAVSKKLSALSYLQEYRGSELSLLATGSVLNLYLNTRKSSQANLLIGLQPNTNQLDGGKKFLITADVNMLLRNALGSGETLGLVWQQLQQKSPRLNLLFEQPYVFHSSFGLNFSLDMYKRDSLFLNINMNLGTQYHIGETRLASVFLQRRQTIVSGINTNNILQSRKLPQEADVSSLNLGVGYQVNTTDYRFNPKKGSEWSLTTTAGTKKIRKNNQVLELKDPSDPSFNFERLYDTVRLKAYQFRIQTAAAQFIPLGKQSTFKLGLNAAVYQSPSFFRNELFQIGGYKLLRGFDEESQFVSQYAVGTAEYRILLSRNSFFFVFADGGWGKHVLEAKRNHGYFGTGLGMSIETKGGIINLAWAVGKRDDTDINLRQSKIHVGFASYF